MTTALLPLAFATRATAQPGASPGVLSESGAPIAPAAASQPATSAQPSPLSIQAMIDSAAEGAVITLPKGNIAESVTIKKPLTLRCEEPQACVFNVVADGPAILVQGARGVLLENLAIRWGMKSAPGTPIGAPDAAVAVLDGQATLKECRIAPLSQPEKMPYALLAADKAEVAFLDGYIRGFAYAINFAEGSKGSVERSAITAAGHSAVLVRPGASAKVAGNLLAKCGYHAVRVTGGAIELTGNLIADNKRAGAYLGNQSASGTIAGNVFHSNSGGIWAYAQSEATIERNLFVQSSREGIAFGPECKLSIRGNVIGDNPTGVKLVIPPGGSAQAQSKLEGNLYWANQADATGVAADSGAVVAQEIFTGYRIGDFTLDRKALPEAWQKAEAGLADPAAMKRLWVWYSTNQRPPTPTPEPTATPAPSKPKREAKKKPAKKSAAKKPASGATRGFVRR